MDSSSSAIQHPVDAFLTGIAPALKNLSPQNCHYAKADIFAAVQKYELKMLIGQQQFPESSHFSNSSSTPTYFEAPSPSGSYHPTQSANEYPTTSSTERSQQTTSHTSLLRLEGGYHQYASTNECKKKPTIDRSQPTTLLNPSLQQYFEDYSG